MRRLLLFLLVCSTLHTAQAADEPARSIAVSGRAVIKVQADRFIITGVITGSDPKAIAASEALAQRDLDALAKLTAPTRPMVLSRASQRLFERSANGTTTFTGYGSTISFQLTVGDLEQCRALYRQVLTIGSAEISGLDYQATQQIALREQARDQALLAARSKAAHMAGVLDARLGPVTRIGEGGDGWDNKMAQNNGIRSAIVPDEAVQAYREGEIEIAATVEVTFALQ